jgi:hypothetical protein
VFHGKEIYGIYNLWTVEICILVYKANGAPLLLLDFEEVSLILFL